MCKNIQKQRLFAESVKLNFNFDNYYHIPWDLVVNINLLENSENLNLNKPQPFQGEVAQTSMNVVWHGVQHSIQLISIQQEREKNKIFLNLDNSYDYCLFSIHAVCTFQNLLFGLRWMWCTFTVWASWWRADGRGLAQTGTMCFVQKPEWALIYTGK